MDFVNFKEDEEYSDESLDAAIAWTQGKLEEYRKDEVFSNLTEIQQDYADFIIKIFTESCYNYGLKKPGQWDLDIVEEVLLDIFPRKISAEIACFESIVPVLISFIQWCEYKGYLSETKLLCKEIKEFARDIVERAKDPSNWGFAKSIMMGGIENIQDSGQDFYEARSQPILVNKIGRNEPCPCGSGKKYKKCCLTIDID